MARSPVVLVVLDGFGYRKESVGNAILQAKKPFFDHALKTQPFCLLKASGSAVGLMAGQQGNSQVGHLTIGAGRRVPSDLVRINESIANGSFFSNKILLENFAQLRSSGKTLHLIGLLSDAGVHAYNKHVYALLQVAKNEQIKNVMIHAFLDGRDSLQRSAGTFLAELESQCKDIGIGTIGSIHGRYFAMDRDKHWDRTRAVYEALIHPLETKFISWQEALSFYYADGISDEFIPPTQLHAMQLINKNDGVIFFNFRPDRARQLTAAFVNEQFNDFEREFVPLSFFITLTEYDDSSSAKKVFESREINNTLKEVLAQHGKSLFTIAETEKYAHATYFFNGLNEKPVANETRVLIPSHTHRDFVREPCMSANAITDRVVTELKKNNFDFYLVNYANADMVGHSGNMEATIEAIECLDEQLARLWHEVAKVNGTLCITGDHGKAEQMIDVQTGEPFTAHTANPVYFIVLSEHLVKPDLSSLKELSDIAPWILKLMQVPIAQEMNR
jgi:2,3-bisphosphoglycerate-independent phosphoglycerate mutase